MAKSKLVLIANCNYSINVDIQPGRIIYSFGTHHFGSIEKHSKNRYLRRKSKSYYNTRIHTHILQIKF